ncbi:MAG: DUF4838 domain-containing protein [Kiritimatiellia bacterium]
MIIEDGRAQAVIVTAENPVRTVQLAADDLQLYLEKISGARLAITNAPDPSMPVTLYVGRSPHTDALGITAAGLQYDAFRLVAGPDYLVMIGRDDDFVPRGPHAMSRKEAPQAQAEWDELTGGLWRLPYDNLWRRYNGAVGVCAHDGAGSFNAVCEFLRGLGVRWYMPGELGEVVPDLADIPLPAIDLTVKPDYAVRHWHGSYMAYAPETVMWEMRQGMNSGYEVLGAGMHVHGMRLLMGRPEMFSAHPDYYAVFAGQRDSHHACFASEGLVQESARFARAVFDILGEPVVSLWPNDGLRQCQCEKCWGQNPSDFAWGFIDRVAREVYKTHPDKFISGGAYAAYRQPPPNIARFSPNVLVFLAAHRPGLDQDETWAEREALVAGWLERTGPGRLIRNSNNYYDMVVHPRSFDRELKALQEVSLGDWNEVRRKSPARGEPVVWLTPGIDHLNQYVNARLLWDADLDLDALFDEYYTLFYGPARDAMQAAWEFAEAGYKRTGRARFELPERIRFLELLQQARAQAGDTVYGARIQLIMDEIGEPDQLRRQWEEQQAAALRPDVPLAIGRDLGGDGPAREYKLRDLETGDEADVATSFTIAWEDNAIIFDLTCHEPDMANLFVSKDIWGGDSMALLLETPSHCYYQIEINPDGDIVDALRQSDNRKSVDTNWSSEAEIVTRRGDDYWGMRIRLPVVGEAEGVLDPLHFVVGEKPTVESPWYFQVGRVRIRDGKKSAYGFSPSGKTYHNISKFGKLVVE